jgi:hypothetical protein
MLITGEREAFQSIVVTSAAHFTVQYAHTGVAAYPRVGRYAMQPIACFAKAGGPPGDTSYKYGHQGTLQYRIPSKGQVIHSIGTSRASRCLCRKSEMTIYKGSTFNVRRSLTVT